MRLRAAGFPVLCAATLRREEKSATREVFLYFIRGKGSLTFFISRNDMLTQGTAFLFTFLLRETKKQRNRVTAMSGEVDFWTATIQAYSPLGLGSPELTPKLLKRPPFRFIHDIVRAINARFDAYTRILQPPLDSASTIETKEQKVEYLTLLIDYVGELLNVPIDVNPKKIVSGSEPEKTNVFLQYLALAVGNAQRRQQEINAQAPPPPPPAEIVPVPPDSSSPASSIDRSTLPRHAAAANRAEVLGEAALFQKKIASYGINLSDPYNIQEDGRRIVSMWKELDAPPAPLAASPMPQEALEIAINRQIEALKQVHKLSEENNLTIQKIESVM